MNVSIVLEWENVVLSGESRTQWTLPELRHQIKDAVARHGLRVEVILVYSTKEFEPAQIESTIKDHFSGTDQTFAVRPVAFDEGAYWEKKNAGAADAKGEIVVFFDSDTAPEAGWLEALLAPFERQEVQALGGETYAEVGTRFYTRAMSLFWLFPLRTSRCEVVPTKVVYANNCAFRRSTFLKYQYRSSGQFRSGGADLQRRMEQDGIVTYLQPNARCAHPPPNGFVHFVRRAACEGHDSVIAMRNTTGKAPWRQSYWTLKTRTVADLRNIRRNYRQVGLSSMGLIGAFGLCLAYSSFILMGQALTRIDPGLVRRHLGV